MRCRNCAGDLPAGSRSCGICGAAAGSDCPACGHPVLPDARFCSQCGTRIEAGAGIDRAAGASASPLAERRQLTVMFCDLVGSTDLASRMDPEDLHAVMGSYQVNVAATVARSGGFVARYMGDGVLVYFGWPQADETDTERAVRAGLDVLDGMARTPAAGHALRVRIGVATGLVVIGDMIGSGPAREASVVGETPHLAARLQVLAEPDSMVIDRATRLRIGGLFRCSSLGPVPIKGFAEPLEVWRVEGASRVQSRFEALHAQTLTPLVGREEELALLLERWRQAQRGDGRLVLLSGEAGIGKSRLLAELEQHLESQSCTPLRYFCSPHHQDSALHPIIGNFEHGAGFDRGDMAADRLRKLRAAVAPTGASDEDVALFADLLSIPADDPPPLRLNPRRKKDMTYAALYRLLERLATDRPVLMLLEDAHWSDPSTLDLLDLLVQRIQTVPVLLVITSRPEFRPPWIGQPGVSAVTLGRLDRLQAAALAGQVTGDGGLTSELLARIATQADGVPLFVEELTKAVLESGIAGSASAASLSVPGTLQASLIARLDRNPAAKQVAHIGAAIGREFRHDVLAAVAPIPAELLRAGLDALVASGLVFRHGEPPDAVYRFKHALVQDAAYESLLRGSRGAIHAKVVQAILELQPGIEETQPELLGYQCAQAGLFDEAARYDWRAGEQAASRSALAEARVLLERALGHLAALPPGSERELRELEVLTSLGSVLVAVKGYAAPETGQAYTRARELWERLGRPPRFLKVGWGQWMYHGSRIEVEPAQRVAEDLLRFGREQGDTGGLLVGHTSVGAALMVRGDPASARPHLEAVLSLHDPAAHGHLVQHTGVHPHTLCGSFLGLALFWLGYPDQARARCDEAIARDRQDNHAPSLASSLSIGARLLSMVGDEQALAGRVAELVGLTREQGFPLWAAQATLYEGWLAALGGDLDGGIAMLRQGRTAYRSSGGGVWDPHHAALLADALDRRGDVDEALELMAETLATVERTGETWVRAELIRRKGELHARRGETALAERTLAAALEVARAQNAGQWVLRAATSLSRLRCEQGRQAEAHALLAPVLGWFTEGFDTEDWRAARAMLGQLAR